MSDSKEKDEGRQNVPLAEESGEIQQLVDVQVQPEALAAPEPGEKTSNHAKDGKVETEAPNGDINEKVEAVAAAVDKNLKPEANSECIPQHDVGSGTHHAVPIKDDAQALDKIKCEIVLDEKSEAEEATKSDKGVENSVSAGKNDVDTFEVAVEAKVADRVCNDGDSMPSAHTEPIMPADRKSEIKNGLEIENKDNEMHVSVAPADNGNLTSKNLCFLDADHSYDGNESGTDEEQSAFMKELENFFRERSMEFKPPKFYGEGLNCLKLWRAVIRLGGYDKVTTCKLWRQVGESFKPPKTCTTVSWTFRGFYEKALLDYERHKTQVGELNLPIASISEPMNIENQSLLPDKSVQALASGRARRDAAARAMQGWHSQRLLGNGEVSDPIIKDRSSLSVQKREKQLKSINLLKRKTPSYMDNTVKAARSKPPSKPQLETSVIDIGPPADWVKINVQKTKDCFEIYALVPGLLREEVRVQSDPAGRLVISGEPEHPDNPWGVTPFKKVVCLPSRIDPHQTSAVVTLHGQLFVRVPFEQSE